MFPKVILVTGANRGIGFSIIQALATRTPGDIYILGVRSYLNGEEATKKLRDLGITAKLEFVELDVTNDEQICRAVAFVRGKYGRLDVLINNAAIASNPTKPDLSDFRTTYQSIFNANITSPALLSQHFLTLLKTSPAPAVINISSARASVNFLTDGKNPPTVSVPYSVSKTALNMVTLEMGKLEKGVRWFVVSPGHCRTGFNGFRGVKDPVEGARVVVELVNAKEGLFGGGFWEFEGGEMRVVPW